MHFSTPTPRRRGDSVTRQVATAIAAVMVLSACSGSKATPTRVTEVAPPVALSVTGSGTGSGRVVSLPAGIDCTLAAGSTTGACTARFPVGTLVVLQPAPSGTSVFVAFSGDCALSDCATTMAAPRSVTATFVPNALSVLANAASSGGGRITSAPAGIDCLLTGTVAGTGACTASFAAGTEVTLTQEPSAGAVFQAWSSSCTGNPCLVTMNGQRLVDVTWRVPAPPGTLAVTGFGTGNGSVTSSPSGIACTINAGVASGTCSASFPSGGAVALVAAVSGSSSFSGFTGACAGPTCAVTIAPSATSSVSAGFTAPVVETPPPAPPAPVKVTVGPSPASRGSGTITSSPAGISCSVNDGTTTGTCTMMVASGTTVTLTQSPTGMAILQGWSGDCAGNPCLLTMTQSRVGEITYRLPSPGAVTVYGTGTGSGSVTSSPSGISCTSAAGVTSGTCTAEFAAGTNVMLIGGGSAGSSFEGFTGACIGTSCTIPVVSSVNAVATAGFTAAPQRLTIAAGSGSAGGGLVTSSPAGINCSLSGTFTSGTCTTLFEANTVVTLLQSTTGVSVFSTWGGDCITTPCQVTMSKPRAVQAVFQTQGLKVVGGGTGNGTVTSSPAGISCTVTAGVATGSCSSTHAPNTVVTLTSTPAGLHSFSGYSGACLGTSCSVTIVTGTTSSVTAQFDAPPTLTFAAQAGSAGGGTLVSTPAGLTCTLSGVSTSGACSTAYALNTSVSVAQSPTPGSVFVTWGGACSGTGSCIVPLSSSRVVQAQYRLAVPGAITVNSGAGTGNGSVSSSPGGLACTITNTIKGGICRAIFPVGSTVTLIPVASTGFKFTGFSGACSGTATCTLVVPENGELIVSATFTP